MSLIFVFFRSFCLSAFYCSTIIMGYCCQWASNVSFSRTFGSLKPFQCLTKGMIWQLMKSSHFWLISPFKIPKSKLYGALDKFLRKILFLVQTLPKAQRTRGLSSSCQSNFLRSYHKFKHKSASTKNLNQTSASPLNLKFKVLTKPSFRISTKIQLHNLYKTSAAKCWTNFNFKILTNPCAQSLNKSLALGPNVSSQIYNKLLPTWSSASTSATVTTSTSFKLATSHARVTSIKFTKQESVS